MSITDPPKVISIQTPEYQYNKITFACDDDQFSFCGDMLTPRVLRDLDLCEPENIAARAQWLAEYAQSGIGDDVDPGAFEFTLTVTAGETSGDLARRAVAAVEGLREIRRLPEADCDE
jgi:hypothetical protein